MNLESKLHIVGLETELRYRITLHKSEEGYSVSVPNLPGCWSQGVNEKEARDNIKAAIDDYLAVRVAIHGSANSNRSDD